MENYGQADKNDGKERNREWKVRVKNPIPHSRSICVHNNFLFVLF